MSSPQGDMATQPPQSLPSFAQTFGSPSLNRMPDMNNALPPIQHRASPFDRPASAHASPQPTTGDPKYSKKRTHPESAASESQEGQGSDGRRSPRPVLVKEETESEALPPPKAVPQPPQKPRESTFSPPSTSNSPPNPAKKRRVGPSLAIPDTDVRRPSVDNGISPVVMGFTIPEDDPKAMEQVRSMINLKQQQQALIEQRRGSTAGVLPPTAPPDVNVVNPHAGQEERAGPSSKGPLPARMGRRSPPPLSLAQGGGPRRSIIATSSSAPPPAMSSSARHPSPPPPPSAPPSQSQSVHNAPTPSTLSRNPSDSPPTQTHLHPSAASTSSSTTGSHALPAPPISFARRRASRQLAGGKMKPADIVISPRTASESHLQPYIQSAPPIPRGSQSGPSQASSVGGRPTMALPSLLPVPAPGQTIKRYSTGQVPPTPTRLAMARHSVAGSTATGITGRSPPTATIPISSTLVPPTPASLHHQPYTGEKSAFLAPFEMFYDALADSKQLKTWLADQLQKSNALLGALQRQQEQHEDVLSALVDKKVAPLREELYGLRVRVDELEAALRGARAQGYSPHMSAASSSLVAKGKSKANGYQPSSSIVPPHAGPPSAIVPESYTFPPVDTLRRPPSEKQSHARVGSPASDTAQSFPGSQNGSPVPFEVGRRLSVSATRFDPPRQPAYVLPPHNFPPRDRDREQVRGEREGRVEVHKGPGSWSPQGAKPGLPPVVRSSLSHTTMGERDREYERERGRERERERERVGYPEKRRASRSPEADEEDRRDRDVQRGPTERERDEADRSPASHRSPTSHRGSGSTAAHAESPMDES